MPSPLVATISPFQGVLRALQLEPRLTLNVFGGRDNPMLSGGVMVLLGIVMVVVAVVQ